MVDVHRPRMGHADGGQRRALESEVLDGDSRSRRQGHDGRQGTRQRDGPSPDGGPAPPRDSTSFRMVTEPQARSRRRRRASPFRPDRPSRTAATSTAGSPRPRTTCRWGPSARPIVGRTIPRMKGTAATSARFRRGMGTSAFRVRAGRDRPGPDGAPRRGGEKPFVTPNDRFGECSHPGPTISPYPLPSNWRRQNPWPNGSARFAILPHFRLTIGR